MLPPSTSSFVLQQNFSLPSLGAGLLLRMCVYLLGGSRCPPRPGSERAEAGAAAEPTSSPSEPGELA